MPYLPGGDEIDFSDEGVTVVTAPHTEVRQETPDAIVLNATSPEYGNPETFEKIYSDWPQIPIVVVATDEETATHAVEWGASDCVIKQELGARLLHRTIRNAIDRSRMLDQLQAARKLEHHLVYHDPLTGLPNRLKFREYLKDMIDQSKKTGAALALLCVDIDQFKRVNDSLGHEIGDRLLQQVANRLDEQNPHIVVSRLGDDEFTIILENIGTVASAAKVARQVLEKISHPFEIDGHELYITVSIGLSLYPFDGTDISTLIKKADIAMYRAKSQGRNRYESYQYAMDEKLYEYFALENNLRKAIVHKQLITHFQPQLCLRTGKIVGVEALIRWQHPKLGFMYPDKFISLAEESGVIVELDQWMLRTACRKLKGWQDIGFESLRLGVNLSAHQFQLKSLIEAIERILIETNLDPGSICLEITESDIMRSVDKAVETLTRLKKMGLQISVDDFGTGYASFHYLKQFPIDILKIDHTFVKGIPEDRNNAAISTAIINLAKSMGLRVIAEGVETRSQLEYLQDLRCDEVQGFYFSRPVADHEIACLLKSGGNGFQAQSHF